MERHIYELELGEPPKKKFNYKPLLPWIAFVLTLIIVYAVPFILWYSFTTKNTGVQYGTVGTIGDAFGMVAPFINLIGAVFVYLAFRQQLVANALLQRQIDETKTDEVFTRQFETLEKRIGNIEHIDENQLELYGFEAVEGIVERMVYNNCEKSKPLDKDYGEDVFEVCSLIRGIDSYKRKHKISSQEELFTGTLFKTTVRKYVLSMAKGYGRIVDAPNCRWCDKKHKPTPGVQKFISDMSGNYITYGDIKEGQRYLKDFVDIPNLSNATE